MIVTFCGHSQFFASYDYENIMLETLESEVGDQYAEFYLGGYGGFDSFSHFCCKKYQNLHPSVKLVFVTPYLNVDPMYEQNYDSIVYPAIEDKPRKFAISYRNRYMIDSADIVIAYIDHAWGGAYKTYSYAKRKKKRIINLGKVE